MQMKITTQQAEALLKARGLERYARKTEKKRIFSSIHTMFGIPKTQKFVLFIEDEHNPLYCVLRDKRTKLPLDDGRPVPATVSVQTKPAKPAKPAKKAAAPKKAAASKAKAPAKKPAPKVAAKGKTPAKAAPKVPTKAKVAPAKKVPVKAPAKKVTAKPAAKKPVAKAVAKKVAKK